MSIHCVSCRLKSFAGFIERCCSSAISSLIPRCKSGNLVIKHKNAIPVGISLPVEIKEQLEYDRGDISLSRYILRIIEKHYNYKFSDLNTKLRARLEK